MQNLILFFKGFIIGIGKVIPGVSGSLLAVCMGVYDKALDSIATFCQHYKKNFGFLFVLGLGILVSIMLFSRVILLFLTYFPLFTMAFFLGLFFGTIPKLVKQVNLVRKDYLFILVLFLAFWFVFSLFRGVTFRLSYGWIFVLGMIEAFSMIVPGVSGTSINMMLGSYTFLLSFMANPFGNIFYLIFFVSGFLATFLVLVKFLDFLLKSYARFTWVMILGFLLFSFVILLGKTIVICDSLIGFMVSFILGLFVVYFLPS